MDNKYRFNEIITTIALIEDTPLSDLDSEEIVLPNFTAGLEDMWLINAIVAQASRESDDFRQKLYIALCNSSMRQTIENHEITQSSINAFALAGNLAWASGAGHMVFKALGYLTMACEGAGLEIPDFAYTVLDDPSGVLEWSAKQDPYSLLEGNKPEIPFGSNTKG